MSHALKKLSVLLLGIIIGMLSYYFLNGWFNIIPWSVVTLAIGYTTSQRKDTIIFGALFGYSLFFTYILVGYRGSMDPMGVLKIVGFTFVFSFAGSLAGIVGALIGKFIRQKIHF